MTCIAALVDNGKVYVGGDSAAVMGMDVFQVREPKVGVIADHYVAGFTTSFRMGQLLLNVFRPPEPPIIDLTKFMVSDFIAAWKKCLYEDGTRGFGSVAGQYLVGVWGRIFKIDSDMSVLESLDGFDACGCGQFYALGSLASTERQEPFSRIYQALAVAAKFSTGVRTPFTVLAL